MMMVADLRKGHIRKPEVVHQIVISHRLVCKLPSAGELVTMAGMEGGDTHSVDSDEHVNHEQMNDAHDPRMRLFPLCLYELIRDLGASCGYPPTGLGLRLV